VSGLLQVFSLTSFPASFNCCVGNDGAVYVWDVVDGWEVQGLAWHVVYSSFSANVVCEAAVCRQLLVVLDGPLVGSGQQGFDVGPALHRCNGRCFDSASDEAEGSVLDPLEDLEDFFLVEVMKTSVQYSRMGRTYVLNVRARVSILVPRETPAALLCLFSLRFKVRFAGHLFCRR
jgi:hypothetical protein